MGTSDFSWKKVALYAFVGSLGVSALLGIMALLSGDFGDLQIKILLTTLVISGASICALSYAAVWESRRYVVLPLFGVVLTLAGACLTIGGLWLEPDSDTYWKLSVTAWFFAVGSSHLSLLSLARLDRRFAWSRPAVFILVYGLAVMLTLMVWGELEEEGFLRFVGVTAILAAALSIAMPVFHKLSGTNGEEVEQVSESGDKVVRMLCPRCGLEQTHVLGKVKCVQCSTVFSVTILK